MTIFICVIALIIIFGLIRKRIQRETAKLIKERRLKIIKQLEDNGYKDEAESLRKAYGFID